MRDAIDPLMFTGGFMDRTVVVYRDPLPNTFPTPPPRDPLVAVRLGEALRPLTARLDRQALVATPEAHEWYDNWYRGTPEYTDAQMPSVKRQANNLFQLAGTFALSDQSAPYIHTHHFEKAAAVFDRTWRDFGRFLLEMERTPEITNSEYLEKVIWEQSQRAGMVSRRQLFNVVRQKAGLSPPSVKALPLLESLEMAGRVEKVVLRTGSGGRPTEAYRLTDEAAEEWDTKPTAKVAALRPVRATPAEEPTPASEEK
jgi:hypothetical protein